MFEMRWRSEYLAGSLQNLFVFIQNTGNEEIARHHVIKYLISMCKLKGAELNLYWHFLTLVFGIEPEGTFPWLIKGWHYLK